MLSSSRKVTVESATTRIATDETTLLAPQWLFHAVVVMLIMVNATVWRTLEQRFRHAETCTVAKRG